MRRILKLLPLLLVVSLAAIGAARSQTPSAAAPDLTKQPTLYLVGYAHLDTQWRWDYVTTIKNHLPNTMRLNFDLFEKYPHYIFNFSGANRYRMMKEYYPADYAKVKQYVAAGRWFPAGSAMEENDVNSPSAESVIRQVLYGKHYFRREFGKTSAEYMLPDCFGFPASLPSILAHAGIKGFSTQKLNAGWQPAPFVGGPDSPEQTPLGIPFNVGIWEGPDGNSVIAALNPGDYTGSVTYDLSKSPSPLPPDASPQQRSRPPEDWVKRININGNLTGIFADYHYYGTGDVGGAPNEASVRLVEAIVTQSKTVIPPASSFARRGPPQATPTGPEVQVGDGPVRVVSATSDQMFLDIKPEQTTKFPRYKGDLELINHSAGSINSETYMKRWNRKNEVLADDAERASVAALLLGGRSYPIERLNNAWTLVMGGQFHDIIPGTSLPKAYEYSWNDEILAMNQFAAVLASATEAVASVLDTQAKGTAIVVYNALNIPREEVVEATVTFPGGSPKAVRVFGPDGTEVPAQLAAGNKVLFVAKTPSVGYAVYDVQPATTAAASTLKVDQSSLENARYHLKLNPSGDVVSIFDKSLNKELLSAPIRLAIKTDNPRNWPAWNMDWDQQQAPPRAYVSGPAEIRVVENGAARVALEVARATENSKFVETIRLSAGDAGNRVEFGNSIDWKTAEANLKATFPLTASNPKATYNWDIGTLQRGNDMERQFEVASHQWVDLTDTGGSYGVTVLTDCKNASDKPDDKTLRLTLVRTPGTRGGYPDQGSQDWGHHEFVYGLASHSGDFRQGQTDWQAFRLNQPLIAFEAAKHPGALGKNFSLLSVSNSRIRVLAVKKAEQSDEVVIRLVEMDGKAAPDVKVKFAASIAAAREINGAEENVGPATLASGELVTSFMAFQPRTFALKLGAATVQAGAVRSQPVELTCDLAVASNDGTKSSGGFDADGRAVPAELLPVQLDFGGIRFNLAPAQGSNAVVARGQTISLPAGTFNRVYLLAASADGDQKATFRIGDTSADLTVQNWGGYIGQWDNRIWKGREMAGLTPGFIKPAPVAWFASHRHTAAGANEPYAYSYLFAYGIDAPANAKTLTLPNNDKIRILAVSTADEGPLAHAAQVLTDTQEK
jgi:alpha-mannosidase